MYMSYRIGVIFWSVLSMTLIHDIGLHVYTMRFEVFCEMYSVSCIATNKKWIIHYIHCCVLKMLTSSSLHAKQNVSDANTTIANLFQVMLLKYATAFTSRPTFC